MVAVSVSADQICWNFNLMSLCCMFEWNKNHLVRKTSCFGLKQHKRAWRRPDFLSDNLRSHQTSFTCASAWTAAPSLHFLIWNSHHKHLTWRRYDTYCRNVSSYIKYHTCQVSIKVWIPATECETFYRWVDRGKVTKTQWSLNTFTVTEFILPSIHQVTAAAVCF